MTFNGGISNSIIKISIGNIGIFLDVEPEALAGRIRSAYREFTKEINGNVTINIISSGAKLGGTGETPRLEIKRGLIKIEAPQLNGTINYETGYGRVIVSSNSPEAAVEYVLRIVTAILAVVKAGGLLFHGAGIVHHGLGYLFFGPSGSGKTTVAKLSPDDIILNDDLVMLVNEDGRWIIHATPFTHLGQIKPSCSSAPLSAMFRLVKDRRVFLEPMSQAQALAEFVANIPVLAGKIEFAEDLLMRGESLVNAIPLYRLHFSLDNTFWSWVDTAL